MSDKLYCPTCLRDDFKSLRGLTTHINSMRDCSNGMNSHKQKQREQLSSGTHQTSSSAFQSMSQYSRDLDHQANSEFMDEDEEAEVENEDERVMDLMDDVDTVDQEAFHFVDSVIEEQEEMIEIGVAGPGPATEEHRRLRQHQNKKFRAYVLDEDDDTRFEEEHGTAGKVIKMNSSLHEQWRALFHHDDNLDDMDVDPSTSPTPENIYSPFASELDWRVARWAVKDGIGHKSLDRLLAIPGVSCE